MTTEAKFTPAQKRFLALFAGSPEPSKFQWLGKKDGRFSRNLPTSDCDYLRATARLPNGRVFVATIPKREYRGLEAAGLMCVLQITPEGRAALSRARGGDNG